MANYDDDWVGLLFGGALALFIGNARQSNIEINKRETELKKFKPIEHRKNLIQKRNKQLNEFALDKIIDLVDGDAKAAFIEAVECYVVGFDIAASSMICLSLEVYLKVKLELRYGKESSLKKQYELFFNDKLLQPTQLKLIHYLRDQRNIQAHEVNKLDEIDLLGMFKIMKDLVGIFSPKSMNAEINE